MSDRFIVEFYLKGSTDCIKGKTIDRDLVRVYVDGAQPMLISPVKLLSIVDPKQDLFNRLLKRPEIKAAWDGAKSPATKTNVL